MRLAGQVTWLHSLLEREPFDGRPRPDRPGGLRGRDRPPRRSSNGPRALLEGPPADTDRLDGETHRLRRALRAMEREVTAARVPGDPADFVASLEPSFRAQEISFAISEIAANVEIAVAAEARSWRDRLLGHQAGGLPTRLTSARARVTAHADRHSVWLRNSIRAPSRSASRCWSRPRSGWTTRSGWCSGRWSVLRSNAVTTGQSALKALAGTAIGFGIGAFLPVGRPGQHGLPVDPAADRDPDRRARADRDHLHGRSGGVHRPAADPVRDHRASPAGEPASIRLEDIAVGCLVSLLAGALFWPRGARAALGRAFDEAFCDNARYFRGAVEFGVTRCDLTRRAVYPAGDRAQALGAMQRLDDAFRGYLAERGTKRAAPVGGVAAGQQRDRAPVQRGGHRRPVETGAGRVRPGP